MKEYVTYKFVQRQRSARARVNAHTCANCAVNIIIKHKIITLCNVSNTFILQNVNKKWHVRSTLRHTQPNCKLHFAKYRKNTFYSANICTCKKNAVLLHRISQIAV